jgi:hypothetical protein
MQIAPHSDKRLHVVRQKRYVGYVMEIRLKPPRKKLTPAPKAIVKIMRSIRLSFCPLFFLFCILRLLAFLFS